MGTQIVRTDRAVEGRAIASIALMNDYVLHWARNPNPGSWFDWLTLWRYWVSDDALLRLLSWMRYGAQIYIEEGRVVNHIFHQRHGEELHLFSIFTLGTHQKRNIAKRMLREWLIEAWNTPGINKVRISAGGDAVVAHMYEEILKGAYDIPFAVGRGEGPGWVNLIR